MVSDGTLMMAGELLMNSHQFLKETGKCAITSYNSHVTKPWNHCLIIDNSDNVTHCDITMKSQQVTLYHNGLTVTPQTTKHREVIKPSLAPQWVIILARCDVHRVVGQFGLYLAIAHYWNTPMYMMMMSK